MLYLQYFYKFYFIKKREREKKLLLVNELYPEDVESFILLKKEKSNKEIYSKECLRKKRRECLKKKRK